DQGSNVHLFYRQVYSTQQVLVRKIGESHVDEDDIRRKCGESPYAIFYRMIAGIIQEQVNRLKIGPLVHHLHVLVTHIGEPGDHFHSGKNKSSHQRDDKQKLVLIEIIQGDDKRCNPHKEQKLESCAGQLPEEAEPDVFIPIFIEGTIVFFFPVGIPAHGSYLP